MQALRVTLVQTPLHWQDPASNRAMLDEKLSGLGGNTDLIVLPEMFNTGFTMYPEGVAEPHDGASTEWIQSKAAELGAAVTGSLAVSEDGEQFNRLHWATPAGDLHTYDKRHLFRMAGEHEHYRPGRERLIVELDGWRICPLICYDLRFPVFSRNDVGYHLLLYVANWPAARASSWTRLLRARAVENLCFTMGINRVGRDGNNVEYAGNSVALDWLGDDIHACDSREEVTTVTLDASGLARYREKFPAHLDADRFALL
jgi:predicted amidohydrolase